MALLMCEAWGVNLGQIQGPAWIRDEQGQQFYDVEAKIPPGATKGDFQLMLQSLLAERFRVVAHHETRGFPGYDLVVAKGGPKLKTAVNPPEWPKSDGWRFGKPLPPGPGRSSSGYQGSKWVRCQEWDMGKFAGALGYLVRDGTGGDYKDPVPVVRDKTGLTGKYDFEFGFTCESCKGIMALMLGGRFAAAQASAGAAEPAVETQNIFTVLEKQLGLKLVKAEDVPTDFIVVDHAEKAPTEN